MREMIERIMEIDEEARKITDNATKLKFEIEQSVSRTRGEVREDYLKRARERIEKTRITENEIAEEQFKEVAKCQWEAAQRLEEQYNAHSAEWIDMLVKRVKSCSQQ